MAIEISPPLLTENRGKRVALVVGGGPAPGINGVIRAATLEALHHGLEVFGIRDGFKWLAAGDPDALIPLTARGVERIHLQGGSVLGTSREAPAHSDEKMTNVIRVLREAEIDHLISIGGDDTAFTASRVDALTGREITGAHVPKTIDNDLPLPGDIPTFGFQTARQIGTDIVVNLMEDARTTKRWYFVVAMGRSAGHLALGIGSASGAPLTIIPEEFRGERVSLEHFCRILEGGVLKRKAQGFDYGVAIIAEGAAESIDPRDFSALDNVERDDHGHVRLAELPFGRLIKQRVRASLAELGHKVTIVEKNVGYELRCARPVANDLAYTQDLGAAAVRALRAGNTGVLVCMHGAELMPLRLKDLLDPETGKMRVRRVDVDSGSYQLIREYMERLGPDDFEPDPLAKLAAVTNLEPEAFAKRFGELNRPA